MAETRLQIDRQRGHCGWPSVYVALSCLSPPFRITAAVVGVVLNLAVWFALHVVFGEVNEVRAYGLKLQVPVLATIDIASLVLAVAAFVAMLRFHVGMIPVIGVSAALRRSGAVASS